MNLAFSNIAWPASSEDVVLELFREFGLNQIEIAPTKIWSKPIEVTEPEAVAVRKQWEVRGFQIVAMQALLFGKPELTLFESPERREETYDYLRAIIRMGGWLGARVQVFGSPKNRRINGRSRDEVHPEAVAFFSRIAEVAEDVKTTLVLEANPVEYGADYITSARDAIELVQAVNRPGFRLHLDSACMSLAGDSPAEIVQRGKACLAHVHISEPYLAPIDRNTIDHAAFALALRTANYPDTVSIEMKESEPFKLDDLRHAIELARNTYLAGPQHS